MDARILAVARAERVTSWQVLRDAGCAGASGDRWARGRSDGAQAAGGRDESKAPESGLGTDLGESGLGTDLGSFSSAISASICSSENGPLVPSPIITMGLSFPSYRRALACSSPLVNCRPT